MTDLIPSFKLSSTLTGLKSGPVVFVGQPSLSLASEVTPFFRGPKGEDSVVPCPQHPL